MTIKERYAYPREWRNCLNCARLDLPDYPKPYTGGCRKRIPEDKLATSYCGQWYLKELKDL